MRRIEQEAANNEQQEVPMIVDDRPRLSLSDLPWDTVNIVFDFTQHELYKLFRLNRTFTRLINKRRKGLTFNYPDIPTNVFFKSLQKAQSNLQSLSVAVTIKFLKKREFEEIKFRPKMLRILDLRKFDVISETALTRMLDHSHKTLTTFKVSYKN